MSPNLGPGKKKVKSLHKTKTLDDYLPCRKAASLNLLHRSRNHALANISTNHKIKLFFHPPLTKNLSTASLSKHQQSPARSKVTQAKSTPNLKLHPWPQRTTFTNAPTQQATDRRSFPNMGIIFSTIWNSIKRLTYPIRYPITAFQIMVDTLSYLPRAIIENENVSLAYTDFQLVLQTFFSTLSYWLLPALLFTGVYTIKNPPPAIVNEAHHYYRKYRINTLRPYHFHYPMGVFAEYLKTR